MNGVNYKETEIEKYEITGCYIRSDVITGFAGQDTTKGEPYPTRLFYYYLDTKEWAATHLDETYGVLGCEAYIPEERWIFATVEGDVIQIGGGGNLVEKKLPISEKSRVTQLRCIDKRAYAVTTMREVYRRDNASTWTDLSVAIMESEKKNLHNIGFDAIDGFSENDIYVCGSNGDAWHYNGKTWRILDLPTNAMISDMVCGDDGNVYIVFWHGLILKGRDSQWEIIKQSTVEQLESVAWFKGYAYIATWNRLYKLVDDKLIGVAFENGYSQVFCGHLAAGYGHMISAGSKEAHIFDGEKWSVIFKHE